MADSDKQGSSPTKAKEELRLPDGVVIPESIESERATLFTGDVIDMLKQLPINKINESFETFDYQCNLQGDEIRNRRAYLRGILKGHMGRSYLPSSVKVPDSITKDMLEDKDLVDILKKMPVRDINICFRDYDKQMKKQSDQIRNKTAYLIGVIKSGPHYNLPHGVIIPSTISLAMLQGNVLETIQQLPAPHINVAFQEYDDMIQKRGDTIRSRQGYLMGIVKKHKKAFEEEAANLAGASAPGTPSKEAEAAEAQGGATLNLVTESFVKVTNELVVERQARNDLQNQMKQEQDKREETNQRILKLMSELAVEKEQRERSALEVERLKKDLAFERSLRENSEEKVAMLEATRGSHTPSTGTEQDQLQMELSIERGLREKTEKLLQTAEIRIQDLNRELQYAQDRLHEERTKSQPFGGSWMATSPTSALANNVDPRVPPSLVGISELVSMTEFDPETYTFTNKKDSNKQIAGGDELGFLYRVYTKDDILVTASEIIRFLQLDVGSTSEKVQVNLRVQVHSGVPGPAVLNINAVAIANSSNGESAQVAGALSELVEACRAEANNCVGKEALLSVLTTADYWAQNNWLEAQAKHCGEKLEICRMLLKADAINDEVILKHIAAKHGFGGFVEVGKPGLVLLEGLEKKFSSCFKSLNDKQGSMGSMYTALSVVGKSTQISETLLSELLMPKKVALVGSNINGGSDRLKMACQQVGLSDSFSKVLT